MQITAKKILIDDCGQNEMTVYDDMINVKQGQFNDWNI